jgi:hypothetical protein
VRGERSAPANSPSGQAVDVRAAAYVEAVLDAARSTAKLNPALTRAHARA